MTPGANGFVFKSLRVIFSRMFWNNGKLRQGDDQTRAADQDVSTRLLLEGYYVFFDDFGFQGRIFPIDIFPCAGIDNLGLLPDGFFTREGQ